MPTTSSDVGGIAKILEMLALAYPDKQLSRQSVQVYLENLADIPARILDAAVRAHIQSNPYFPRIAELRQAARKLTGGRPFDALEEDPYEMLTRQAVELEEAFYQRGELDVQAWERLAQQFDYWRRPQRAERTRERLRVYLGG